MEGLLAKVPPLSTIILDNLSIHRTQVIKELTESNGVTSLRFLPPYSCALNPIERAWHVIKSRWRKLLLKRHTDVLKEEDAIQAITSIIDGIDQ